MYWSFRLIQVIRGIFEIKCKHSRKLRLKCLAQTWGPRVNKKSSWGSDS